jgi:uncharacterized membrane protein HdeD (DUF308 family)
MELIAYSRIRHFRGSIWYLTNAAISLVLAVLILGHYPASAVWVPGTIVGVSLLFTGWARLMFPMGGRTLKTAA